MTPRRTIGGAWTAPGVGLYASAEEARQAALNVEADARWQHAEECWMRVVEEMRAWQRALDEWRQVDEQRRARTPLPPEQLVDALQDRVQPASGRLIGAKPIETNRRKEGRKEGSMKQWTPTAGYTAALIEYGSGYELTVSRNSREGVILGEPHAPRFTVGKFVRPRRLYWREPTLILRVFLISLTQLDLSLAQAIWEIEATAKVRRKPLWASVWPLRVFPWR